MFDETKKVVDKESLKAFRKAYDKKLSDGSFIVSKSLTSKQLENVSENSGSVQTAPFNLQATGTENNTTETPTAPIAKHLELRGNSVVWNQLVSNGNFANSTGWSAQNGTLSVSDNTAVVAQTAGEAFGLKSSVATYFKAGIHKFLVIADVKADEATSIRLRYPITSDTQNIGTSYTRLGFIVDSADIVDEDNLYFQATDTGTLNTIYFKNVMVIDLTKLGVEYSSALAFNRDYPEPYYSYNEGEIKSCKSSKLTTIGCNQFDGELEQGLIDSFGEPSLDNNAVRSKNFIKVVAQQRYSLHCSNTTNNCTIAEYDENQVFIKRTQKGSSGDFSLTLSNNTHYVKFYYYFLTATTPSEIGEAMFRLSWHETHDYVPYGKHEYDLPDVELRSAGNVYDEIKADGSMITRLGIIDLGTLNWSYVEQNNRFYTPDLMGIIKPALNSNTKANVVCSKYPTETWGNQFSDNYDLICAVDDEGHFGIKDSNYANKDTFKSSLDGVYLVYELNEYVESNVPSFPENIIVDDFGTMEFNSIIPQGNRFFYPADYVALIDELNSYVNGDAKALAKKTDVANIAGGVLNVINGVDIINNTLTADQLAIVLNGKPTLIKGIFKGQEDAFLFPAHAYGASYHGLLIISSRTPRVIPYMISAQGLLDYISLTSNQYILLGGIKELNGKVIPTYPNLSSGDTHKQLVYKDDNTMAWVNIGGFKIINPPSGTTLTDDEISAISSGCVIKGTFLNEPNPVFMPSSNPQFNEITGLMFVGEGLSCNVYVYAINTNSKVITKYSGASTQRLSISGILHLNGKNLVEYYLNNVYHYATLSGTELKYEEINNISISADTTFTLATAPSSAYPEYKANITNTDTSNAITITLPSGTIIKGNVAISGNTFEIPADSSVEVNIQNGRALVMNWGA